jgi:hypothetical protein
VILDRVQAPTVLQLRRTHCRSAELRCEQMVWELIL